MKALFLMMFMILFDNCFALDLLRVIDLGSMLASVRHKFHVFYWSIVWWLFGWYFHQLLIKNGSQKLRSKPILFVICSACFRSFFRFCAAGMFLKIPWFTLATFVCPSGMFFFHFSLRQCRRCLPISYFWSLYFQWLVSKGVRRWRPASARDSEMAWEYHLECIPK